MKQANYARTLRALKHSLATANGAPQAHTWDDDKLHEPANLSRVLEDKAACDPLESTGSPAMDALMQRAAPRMLYGGAPANCYPPQFDTQPADHDCIVFPRMEAFKSPADYRATLAHELIHWAGADGRTGRGGEGMDGFERLMMNITGAVPAAYAREEMTAEIGAAFLLDALGDDPGVDDRAAYVANWAGSQPKGTRDKLVDEAAEAARVAVDYLLSL